MSSTSCSTDDHPAAARTLTQSPTSSSPTRWDREVIPETHNNRTLVLCFDGTGDKFDEDVRKPTTPFHHYHQPRSRVTIELERRPVYITPKEGQEA